MTNPDTGVYIFLTFMAHIINQTYIWCQTLITFLENVLSYKRGNAFTYKCFDNTNEKFKWDTKRHISKQAPVFDKYLILCLSFSPY